MDYLELPIQTLKGGRAGDSQRPRSRQGERRDDFAGIHLRGLWRSSDSSADRRLLGKCPNPIGPRGVYDEAKRFAEAITMAYHRYHGVDTKIVRIFNTYGPRMRPERWPGRAGLHRAGAGRATAYGVR